MEYFFITHATEDLNYSSQHVLVCDDENFLIVHDSRAYGVLPVGYHALDRHLQRFALRQNTCGEGGIFWIEPRVPLVVPLHHWWWIVVTTPPLKHLLFTPLLGGLLLVETLQLSIVPFIESPMLINWNPIKIHLICDIIKCDDCPFQHGCVADVKLIPCCSQPSSSSPCLFFTFVIKGYIYPS